MNPNEYQQRALETLNPHLSQEEVLTMCVLGLTGESGEIAELYKKWRFHSKGPVSLENVFDEAGDVLWYLSVLAHTLGYSLEEVMQHNLDKLARRHANGFTPHYASDSGHSLAPEEQEEQSESLWGYRHQ